MKKIILNCFPPFTILSPSPALSILKSFLNLHNFHVELIYWNLLFNNLLNGIIRDAHDITLELSPFLSLLAKQNNNYTIEEKIKVLLKKNNLNLSCKENEYLTSFYCDIQKRTLDIITLELAKIDFSQVLLFGISSKFFQWIPGTIIAEKIKKEYPDVKIVVGGFRDKEEAFSVLKLNKCFDFGIWGEGEYPLLMLCDALENSKNNFDQMPRLVYYDGSALKTNLKGLNKSLNFNDTIYPDFDDYFKTLNELGMNTSCVTLPIESSRGCNWNKCRFCMATKGYKYRRKAQQIVCDEIVHQINKHKVFDFFFVDNDNVGENINSYEEVLGQLIKLREKFTNLSFKGEIIPVNLNASILEKMSAAGYHEIQVGWESNSDSLLLKMNKKSSFSDNIFILKFSVKYKITNQCNIIIGAPDETDIEVIDSIDNLHYLRFFLSSKYLKFRSSTLLVSERSRYFKLIPKENLNEWNDSYLCEYLPSNYLDPEYRYKVYDFAKNSYSRLWADFSKIFKVYRETYFHYELEKDTNANIIYKEYKNGHLIKKITLDNPFYLEILKTTNDKVCSIDNLFNQLLKEEESFKTKEGIKFLLSQLKSAYLIYYNKDFSKIISVIDINKLKDKIRDGQKS